MEIGRYLVLSTAHVRCATAELLTAWAERPPTEQPIPVSATPYGWFVPTRAAPYLAALPDELPAILTFGRDQQCAYVLLDSDADELDALPVFPW